ncbi:MAG: hypothetical protein ACM309_09460 [Bacillota bacterium]
MSKMANNECADPGMSLRAVLEAVENYFYEATGATHDGAIVIPFQAGKCLDVRLKIQKSARKKRK